MIIKCTQCGIKFKRNPSAIKRSNFCSRECYLNNNLEHKNKIIIGSKYAEVVLNSNKYGELRSKIDLKDIDKISNIFWNVYNGTNGFYVSGYNKKTKNTMEFIHKYILDYYGSMEIDHINRDPLDNRRCNLRLVSRSTNQLNKSCPKNNLLGIKGIRMHHGKYQARIMVNKKSISIGHFNTLNEAIIARTEYCNRHNILS